MCYRAGADGSGMAPGKQSWQHEQLSGMLGGLDVRKRHIDDDVDFKHRLSATEEKRLTDQRITLRMPTRRSRKKKRRPRPKGSGGGTVAG